MSEKERVQKMIDDSDNRYYPDPVENRGSGNPAADGPNLKFQVAPHMRGYAPPDNSAAVRAKHAEQDKNLHGAPPRPTKP